MAMNLGVNCKITRQYIEGVPNNIVDNVAVRYGITMIIDTSITGCAALFTVGYSQSHTELISDPKNLVGHTFNVEHGTQNGPCAKITCLTNANLVVISIGN